jgi:hypothetical protein
MLWRPASLAKIQSPLSLLIASIPFLETSNPQILVPVRGLNAIDYTDQKYASDQNDWKQHGCNSPFALKFMKEVVVSLPEQEIRPHAALSRQERLSPDNQYRSNWNIPGTSP